MPARSTTHWLPMPPLSGMTPVVASSVAIPLRDAGPWHDAMVCSQMPMVARLADTATPEPLLDPRGTRSVSYGLHACPDHALMACPPGTRFVRLSAGAPRFPGPPLNSWATDFA